MRHDYFHQPVLLTSVADYLVSAPDGVYVDCTLGGGGHAEAILKRLNEDGFLVCLDADSDAIQSAQQRLASFPNKIIRRLFFDQLDVILAQENLLPVQGFLFDLGISSFQIDEKARGFSYQEDSPLDMRFNTQQKINAEEVLNEYPLEKLQQIFREYGEERYWRRIAQAVVDTRKLSRISTTGQLADIVRGIVGGKFLNKSLARIFQAVRIEVNDELNRLKQALEKAFDCLEIGGRIVVIAYHSLEDRITKEFFRFKELDCVCPVEFPQCVCDKTKEMRILTRKPVFPSLNEVEQNPRARSARLRCAEKIVSYRSIL